MCSRKKQMPRSRSPSIVGLPLLVGNRTSALNMNAMWSWSCRTLTLSFPFLTSNLAPASILWVIFHSWVMISKPDGVLMQILLPLSKPAASLAETCPAANGRMDGISSGESSLLLHLQVLLLVESIRLAITMERVPLQRKIYHRLSLCADWWGWHILWWAETSVAMVHRSDRQEQSVRHIGVCGTSL